MLLVFAGDIYYPRGGGDDYVASVGIADSSAGLDIAIAEAERILKEDERLGGHEWAHILYLPEHKIIKRYIRDPAWIRDDLMPGPWEEDTSED